MGEEMGGVSTDKASSKLEEASTHKSAKIHAVNAFVIRDFDLLTPK